MPSQTDLETLERELGPTLREALRGPEVRPQFAASLRNELLLGGTTLNGSPHTGWLRRSAKAWAAIAAVLVVGLTAGSAALFAMRPEAASAAAVEQLQNEAVTMLSTSGGGPCAGTPGEGGVGVTIAQTTGGGSPAPGAVQVQRPQSVSPNELSDKLAQALGVSGDRVRQAMVDTMRAEMPASLPPDPIDGIAKNLGVTRQQVCSAFFDGQSVDVGYGVKGQVVSVGGGPQTTQQTTQHISIGGLDLTNVTAQQLAAPAQRLGVTPERLLEAVHAVVATPLPAPPSPPNKDEIIDRLAANLGMSPDKVKAAMTQVEGPNIFYFAVPDLAKGN
jgi:hypothetical protein